MPPKAGKDKKRVDWVCMQCAAVVHAKAKGYCNPQHHYDALCVYFRNLACKHGHSKAENHLCAWADVSGVEGDRNAISVAIE